MTRSWRSIVSLIGLLAAIDMTAAGQSPDDLEGSEPVSLEEARALLEGRCEEGTVIAPSNRFDGKAGETYRACYEPNHELHYERESKVYVGWWHFAGDKAEIAVCRGPDPRSANCRLLRKKGESYFGVGGSSGTLRYRFETVRH